ncbi:MAG: ArgR family transcriptional regulator [Spirochaetales bacterium]|nr:ArgR family transcriptional regulator [Spirochaetales bacterium]
MFDRTMRLGIIKKLIGEKKISSQEQLLHLLKEKDVHVTQATLSRDLKSLKVGKVSDGNHGYYYTLPDQKMNKETTEHFLEDIKRGYISLAFSANLAVMHTLPGHANTVAFALDRLDLLEITGTIAGDDTILIILSDGIGREEFSACLGEIIPDLELPK